MASFNISTIDEIIREVAATEVMPRFRKLLSGDVEMKGVNDPVTIADKECEKKLSARLQDILPGSVVVGEESFAADKTVMANMDADRPVWVIDPIDGTRNFVEGKPEFAVMVALMRHQKPVASWIHDPNSDDTIMAEHGAGVWLRGQKMRLEKAEPMIGLVGSRVRQMMVNAALPDTQESMKIHIGSCAGFDFPRLFDGEVTFANAKTPRVSFLFYRHTNAWDHIPGLFLHREAGGYAATWAKEPYDMRSPLAGLIYAPTREIWNDLYAFFEPLMQQIQQKAF